MQESQTVLHSFSRNAVHYDAYAGVQRRTAADLATLLREKLPELPAGPVLEIGCGTGLLTTWLMEIVPERVLHVSDGAANMVHQCAQKLATTETARGKNFKLSCCDGEMIFAPDTYALIVSSFTFQWFLNVSDCLSRLVASLKPGGKLIFTVPTERSFGEWKACCADLGLPFTGNPLPSTQSLQRWAQTSSVPIEVTETSYTENYCDARGFFNTLKMTGASPSVDKLGAINLRQLLRYWDEHSPETASATYVVATVILSRPNAGKVKADAGKVKADAGKMNADAGWKPALPAWEEV